MLVGTILLLVILTGQLFYNVNIYCVQYRRGSQQDTGIFPKRTRNVNAWFLPNPSKADPSIVPVGTQLNAVGPYPVVFPPGNGHQPNNAARIRIAKTTACPIFRAQDDGSTDPVLIG
jgi:hypothetical protein